MPATNMFVRNTKKGSICCDTSFFRELGYPVSNQN